MSPSSPLSLPSAAGKNQVRQKDKDNHGDGQPTSLLALHHLPDDRAVYACQMCSEPVALQDELVSQAFTGRHGKAYLMNSTFNTALGKREERKLLTGTHTVADLTCASCSASLGWMYIRAPNGEQRYKEGRYILEAASISKENNW